MAKLSEKFDVRYLPVWLAYQKSVGTSVAAERIDVLHGQTSRDKWTWAGVAALAIMGACTFNNIAAKAACSTAAAGALLYANNRRKLQADFNALQQMPEFKRDQSAFCPYKLETNHFTPPQA